MGLIRQSNALLARLVAPIARLATRGRVASGLVVLACSVALGLIGGNLAPFDRVEAVARDLRVVQLTPPQPPDPDIVVVAVTEETLDRFPFRSPIDRRFLASLLRRLAADGPRAIGLDVILDRPTRSADDEDLRRTLTEIRTPLVIARSADTLPRGSFEARMLANTMSAPPLLRLDPRDDVVRRVTLDTADGQPTMVAKLARVLGSPPTPDGQLIAFAHTRDGGSLFNVIPAHVVLDDKAFAPMSFAGKIVLVGGDFTDVDRHATPLRVATRQDLDPTAGLLIHAYQLRQIIGAPHPREAGAGDLALCLIASVLGMAIAWAAFPLGVRLAAGAVLAPALGLMVFAVFEWEGVLFNLVAAEISFLISASVGFAVDAHERRKFGRRVRAAFAHFLAPAHVDALIRRPGALAPGASLRDIACLFTDLRGFSAFVERHSPQDVASALNAYFDLICATIVGHGGAIDKIVGDAVHAYFGAPIHQPDAAARALACALDLDARLQAFRETSNSLKSNATCMGLHFGRALVGNFGGAHRLDYTAHGSTVNATARLETAAKQLGVRVLASKAIVEAAGAEGSWLPVAALQLAGIALPLDVCVPTPYGFPVQRYLQAYALMDVRPDQALDAFMAMDGDLAGADDIVALQIGRLRAGGASAPIVIA